jgi:THO complex subunit 2
MSTNRDPLPNPSRDPNRDPVNPSRESGHRSHRGENGPGRHDPLPPPPPPPPGRPDGHGRVDDYGNSGRGGPRQGGSFRDSRPRPVDDRGEPPMREDRGRKRRSEEGVGPISSEREKRPRR